jgi:glycosyltransferase involved in cell wall biosynthesis
MELLINTTMPRSSIKNGLGLVALLVSLYFPPEPGGGSITALNRALILQKLGYRVLVLCGFPSYPAGKVIDPKYKGKLFYVEKIEDITLIRLRLLPLKSKGYLRRFILFMNFISLSFVYLPRILKVSNEISLVYALAPVLFSSFIGFIYSTVTQSFFVYEVSLLWPEELIAFRTRLHYMHSFGKVLAKISYTLPDMLVTISEFAAQYLTTNYKPKAMVYALPIGVEPSRFPVKSKESSRKELIERKIFPVVLYNKFIVLYTGIITKITNVENLVHAADMLKDDKDIVFMIVGEGEEKSRLENIKLTHRLNNLFFLPFQDSALVPDIISSADVCVVPLSPEPIYNATIPTKFFDYLACHKPQIGICGEELAMIINSNKIGLTVKDKETDKLVGAILSLRDSPSLTSSMQNNSHAVLQEFSLNNLASKFNKILEKEIRSKAKEK